MILRPLEFPPENFSSHTVRDSQESADRVSSAWAAVERKQKQAAEEWLLIAQPDHAALAGDLAAHLDTPLVSKLDAEVLHGISLHDAGWQLFDGGERGTGRDLEVSLRDPQVNKAGKPLSFLELTPRKFLVAWTESIERAAKTSPIAGILVSEHFRRITEMRLGTTVDTADNLCLFQDFLLCEAERQKHLRKHDRRCAAEIAILVDVLQFCDLLSLYLCCGSREKVEFPQKLSGEALCVGWEGDLLRSEPRLFGSGVSLGVTARRYPILGAVQVSTVGFLIQ